MIFHIDVNSAFLSWSAVKALEEDPNALDLRTVPSAVGGDIKTRHGIITARSIPAKQYGIKTGEPVVKALQKCPELILVRGDFATYRRYSRISPACERSRNRLSSAVTVRLSVRTERGPLASSTPGSEEETRCMYPICRFHILRNRA